MCSRQDLTKWKLFSVTLAQLLKLGLTWSYRHIHSQAEVFFSKCMNTFPLFSHISQAFSRRLTQLAKRHLVWRSWHPASLIKRQTPFTWFNTALIWWWKTTQLLCKDVLFKELRDLEILKQTSFKDVGVSTLIIQRYIVCEWGKL